MSAALQEACEKVLERRQRCDVLDLTCVLCPLRVRGQDALAEHLAAVHGVRCEPLDNIADLDGFLACLRRRLRGVDGAVGCPVCGRSCEDAVALQSHLRDAGHAVWCAESIAELGAYYVCQPATGGSAAFVEDDLDDDEEAASHSGEDEEGDVWVEEECACLFCPVVSRDCLGHMRTVHDFDLPARTRARGDVRDEYDLIRLVNTVRRCVGEGVCPWAGHEETGAAERASCAAEVLACGSLEAHLRAHPAHRLPACVPHGDAALLPVLRGDALLSCLVTRGAGFLPHEEVDQDFPMVPTLLELRSAHEAKQRQQQKQSAAGVE